jgi:hypothetical protein
MSAHSPFFIRMAAPGDVAECREIDVEAWGEDSAASEEMLLSRIATYPCGNFVAIDLSTGKIVGSIWSLSLKGKRISTWFDTSGDGMYGNACDPHGPILYGVNLSMRRAYAGRKVGHLLTERGAGMVWVLGKRFSLFGSRIPEFHQWQKVFSPEDYIHVQKTPGGLLFFVDPINGNCHAGPFTTDAHIAGVRIDPRSWPQVAAVPSHSEALDGELAYFLSPRPKGKAPRIMRLLPGYFPDPDSLDYGVLVGWENDQYADDWRDEP